MYSAARLLRFTSVHVFCVAAICTLLGSAARLVEAQSIEPELPRVYVNAAYPATGGAQHHVRQNDNLQTVINAANPGDTIVLEAGATFEGNFTLPNKSGSGWIVIRTSNMAGLPSENMRVSPSHRTVMPKIVSPNSAPTLAAHDGAHNYRLVGLEVTLSETRNLNYTLIRLGGYTQDEAELPRDIIIDRCYIHGHSKATTMRGVSLNSLYTAVINSYISEIHAVGFDSQAIAGWNGRGPLKIVNNHLAGAGENAIFGGGGSGAYVNGVVPSDIEFRRNHLYKPLDWQNPLVPAVSGIGVSLIGDESSTLPSNVRYYYRIVALFDGFGVSTATPTMDFGSDFPLIDPQFVNEVSIATGMQTTGARKVIRLSWAHWSHSAGYTPTAYKIYRTTSPPGCSRAQSSSSRWDEFIVSSATTSFIDDGKVNSSGSVTDGDFVSVKRGAHWSVKNLFELKIGRRVLVDGNVMENNWVGSQSGFALFFTVRAEDYATPWSVIEDITFTHVTQTGFRVLT